MNNWGETTKPLWVFTFIKYSLSSKRDDQMYKISWILCTTQETQHQKCKNYANDDDWTLTIRTVDIVEHSLNSRIIVLLYDSDVRHSVPSNILSAATKLNSKCYVKTAVKRTDLFQRSVSKFKIVFLKPDYIHICTEQHAHITLAIELDGQIWERKKIRS